MEKRRNINWGNCGGYYITPVVITRSSLGDTAKKVLSYLVTLWGCCEVVHPSTERIMEVTNSSRSEVKRARKELLQLGLISVKYSTGRGNANTYQVNEKRVNDFLGVEMFISATEDTPAPEQKTKNNIKKLN